MFLRREKVSQLALFTGQALFESPLHVNSPYVAAPGAYLRKVEQCLQSGWLTNDGPLVRELECRIASFLGVEHCVAVVNGTLGLQLLLKALGLSGEVILPSFTFVATAHAVRNVGLRPVFCDISSNTWTLDPAHCETLVNSQTCAILGVHLYGTPCDVGGLREVTDHYGLPLVFDSAHAFGCSLAGKRIGGFGDAEVFSFHATKVFHTVEGGAITTDDRDLAERLRLDRNFGFVGVDNVASLGTNAKLSEIHAAMGLTNLGSFADTLLRSSQVREAYEVGLADIRGLSLRPAPAGQTEHNYQYVVAEIDENAAGLSRDLLIDVLWAENVWVRRYFYPGCHAMEPYRKSGLEDSLPSTERAAARVLVLPGGAAMSVETVRAVCELLRFVIDNAGSIKDHPSRPNGPEAIHESI